MHRGQEIKELLEEVISVIGICWSKRESLTCVQFGRGGKMPQPPHDFELVERLQSNPDLVGFRGENAGLQSSGVVDGFVGGHHGRDSSRIWGVR